MYYRIGFICGLLYVSLGAYREFETEKWEEFNTVCMDLWTQTDLVRAININEVGKKDILQKIVARLTHAYTLFDYLYASQFSVEGIKSYRSANRCDSINSLLEAFSTIKEGIEETFNNTPHMAYNTTLTLLDLMLAQLKEMETYQNCHEHSAVS